MSALTHIIPANAGSNTSSGLEPNMTRVILSTVNPINDFEIFSSGYSSDYDSKQVSWNSLTGIYPPRGCFVLLTRDVTVFAMKHLPF